MKSRCNTPLMLNSDYISIITLFLGTGCYSPWRGRIFIDNQCQRGLSANSWWSSRQRGRRSKFRLPVKHDQTSITMGGGGQNETAKERTGAGEVVQSMWPNPSRAIDPKIYFKYYFGIVIFILFFISYYFKFRVNYTPLPSKMLESHSPLLKDA